MCATYIKNWLRCDRNAKHNSMGINSHISPILPPPQSENGDSALPIAKRMVWNIIKLIDDINLCPMVKANTIIAE